MRYLVVGRDAHGEVMSNGYLLDPDGEPGLNRWTDSRSWAARMTAGQAVEFIASWRNAFPRATVRLQVEPAGDE